MQKNPHKKQKTKKTDNGQVQWRVVNVLIAVGTEYYMSFQSRSHKNSHEIMLKNKSQWVEKEEVVNPV